MKLGNRVAVATAIAKNARAPKGAPQDEIERGRKLAERLSPVRYWKLLKKATGR